MAALLTTQEFSRERAVRVLEELESGEKGRDDPRIASVRARLANIERLDGMQARTVEGLERALLEVEEIGSPHGAAPLRGPPRRGGGADDPGHRAVRWKVYPQLCDA